MLEEFMVVMYPSLLEVAMQLLLAQVMAAAGHRLPCLMIALF